MINQVCLSGMITRIEDNKIYYSIEDSDGNNFEMMFVADDNLAASVYENIDSTPMIASVVGKLIVDDNDVLCVAPDSCKVSFLEMGENVLN